MHQNTFLLVSLLAVFAALLVGVNMGKRLSKPQEISTTNSATLPSPSPEPTLMLPQLVDFQLRSCGIVFQYPTSLVKLESASDSALFINQQKPEESVIVTCQKEIPRPPLTEEKIEERVISSVSARLYHDGSAKDGTPIDKLIFRHPAKRLDVYIAGYGEAYNQLISNLQILR